MTDVELPYVARICRTTGGIPLLIELASAWVRAFSCREIAEGFESNLEFITSNETSGIEENVKTVAVFDSLWNLLSKNEQAVLRSLSVFRGGFSEDAARQVAGASPFFLDALVGKVYLRRSPGGHFIFHELLRQFADEKLRLYPREQVLVSHRHCAYYASYVKNQEFLLRGDRSVRLNMGAEIENIRSAWSWAVSQGRIADLKNLLKGLIQFYDLVGWFQEAETAMHAAEVRVRELAAETPVKNNQLLNLLGELLNWRTFFLDRMALYQPALSTAIQALNLATENGMTSVRANTHLQFGRALRGQGDYAGARRHYEQALKLAHKGTQDLIISDSLCELGEVCLSQGDQAKAIDCYQQAFDIYHASNDKRGEGQALNFLGLLYKNRGNFAEAQTCFEKALAIFREIGDRRGEGQVLVNLGLVSTNTGNYRLARLYYEQALPIHRSNGDRQGESWALNCLGSNFHANGSFIETPTYFKQALRLSRDTGDRWGECISLYNLGSVYLSLGEFTSSCEYLHHALELCRELGDRWGESWRLAHLGLYYHYTQDNHAALDYIRQALAVAQENGDVPLQGRGLTYLGHILYEMGDSCGAESAYLESVRLRRELGEKSLTAYPLSGLAKVALDRGDLKQAKTHADEVMAYLETDGLDDSDDPVRLYLVCFQVFNELQDPISAKILQMGYELLNDRAEKLTPDSTRLHFLYLIPSHKAFLNERAAYKEAQTR